MLSKKSITGIVASVSISITVACSSALYMPDQVNTAPGVNIIDLQAGRKLYVSKCGSCHTLVLPEKYSADQWQSLVDKMETKSKITPDEKKLIVGYLTKGKK
jgi:mono/diheme cytochrome c family protein